MALTGLFLCLFLAGHLVGNLQLFIPGEAGKEAFNAYAYFMTSNPAVKVLSYLTYAAIVFHAIDGIVLTLRNRKARPVKYAMEDGKSNASWSSRNMGVLGTVLLVFIAVHLQNFWYQMHFGHIPTYSLADGSSVKDLHAIVYAFFGPKNSMVLASLALYVIAQAAVGFHLWHGFKSAFQSLGLSHPKYTPIAVGAGQLFSVVVATLFAAIPIYIYLTQLA